VTAFYRRWSNDVIETVKNEYIPVAVEYRLPGDNEEADFFHKVVANNGWCYVTADGKVLGKDNTNDGPNSLHDALAKFKELPAAERKPRLPAAGKVGANPKKVPLKPPAGGLIARVYCTYLDRDAKDQFHRAKQFFVEGPGGAREGDISRLVEPSLTWIDMFWMTKENVQSLIPKAPREGMKYPLPESVKTAFLFFAQDLFLRYVAGAEGDLTLTIEQATPTSIRLRLQGTTHGDPKSRAGCADLAWLGYLTYDRNKKVLTRFEVAAVGECWGGVTDYFHGIDSEVTLPGHALKERDKDAVSRRWPIGLAFELVTNDRPVDRIPPFNLQPRED
jgi:hypothetical protein